MDTPSFKDYEEADEFMYKRFRDALNRLKNANTHEERISALKSSNLIEGINFEEILVGDRKIKDYEEYQRVKKLVFNFFNFITEERKINLIQAFYKDNFHSSVENFTMILIGDLFKTLQTINNEKVQSYLILNIFRTIYELNLKDTFFIYKEILEKKNKEAKKASDYSFRDLEIEFMDYPEIEKIAEYFRNDLRNPIAHEEWFLNEKIVYMRNKEEIKKYDLDIIASEIHELLFFRVAVLSCLMKNYDKIVEKINTPEQIKALIKNLEDYIGVIKNKYPNKNFDIT
jgi:ribosomal protein S8